MEPDTDQSTHLFLRTFLPWVLFAAWLSISIYAAFFVLVGPDFDQAPVFDWMEPLQVNRSQGSWLFLGWLLLLSILMAIRLGSLERWKEWLVRKDKPYPAFLYVFIVLLAVYMIHGKCTNSRDNYPTRYLGLALMQGHGFDLSEIREIRTDPRPYYILRTGDRWLPAVPVLRDLMAIPFFAVTYLLNEKSPERLLQWIELRMGAMLVALAGAFVFVSIRYLWSFRTAILTTVALFLGTCVWSAGAHNMWMQAPMIFFSAVGLFFWIRGLERPAYFKWAALSLGFAVATRPTGIHALFAFFAFLLVCRRRQFPLCALFASPPVLAVIIYNLSLTGHPLGGYGVQFVSEGSIEKYNAPFWSTLGVHLFSPSRGLITISPVLLVGLAAIRGGWHSDKIRRAAFWMLLPTLLLILQASKYSRWWGGHSIGYRILIDFFPLMAPVMAAGLERLLRFISGKAIAAILLVFSIIMQGHLERPGVNRWNRNIDDQPERVCSWRGAQWLYPYKKDLRYHLPVVVKENKAGKPLNNCSVKAFRKSILWDEDWTDNQGQGDIYVPYNNCIDLRIESLDNSMTPLWLRLAAFRDGEEHTVFISPAEQVHICFVDNRTGNPLKRIQLRISGGNHQSIKAWDSDGEWKGTLVPGKYLLAAIPLDTSFVPVNRDFEVPPGGITIRVPMFDFKDAFLDSGNAGVRLFLVNPEGRPLNRVWIEAVHEDEKRYSGWDSEGCFRLWNIEPGEWTFEFKPFEGTLEPHSILLSLRPNQRLSREVVLEKTR